LDLELLLLEEKKTFSL